MGSSNMIYLLHIPKTGGTSIQAMLQEYAARTGKRIVGPCLVDDLIGGDVENWTSADILHGHLGSLPLEMVADVKVITVLRDPVTHLHSWYRHVLRAPDHYFHQAVVSQGIGFADWLDWPPARMLVDNPQARYLGTHALMAGAASKFGGSLQETWELGEPALNREELESAARRTLSEALAVGCLDQLADFQVQLAAILAFEPERTFQENVNPNAAEEISADLAARIINELCPIDAALHESCRTGRFPASD